MNATGRGDHRDGAGAEQLQRQHRVRHHLLETDERNQRHRGHDEGDDHRRIGEPAGAGLDGAVGRPAHRQDAGELADGIERGRTPFERWGAGQQP
jgi:hypothetical protein